MKKREGYDFKLSEDKIRYEFTSTGPKGRIGKAVLFEMIAEGVWNLSFGDLSADGDFDDSIVTDNNDMRIVLQSLGTSSMIFLTNTLIARYSLTQLTIAENYFITAFFRKSMKRFNPYLK